MCLCQKAKEMWPTIVKPLQVLAGISTALVGICFANTLLESERISGTDFVALTIAFLIAGLVISLLSQVTELSFADVAIKVERARQAAEVTLKQLHDALEQSLRPQISSAKSLSGLENDVRSFRDSRIDHLLILDSVVKKAGLYGRLGSDLADAAREIARNQITLINRLNPNVKTLSTSSDPLPSPRQIERDAFTAQDRSEQVHATGCANEAELITKIQKAIEAYKSLYSLATL